MADHDDVQDKHLLIVWADSMSVENAHFRAEEELMAKASFPGLMAHQAEHSRFIGTLSGMEKRWQDGDSEVSEQLMDLLQGWLVDHIMKIDMQYSPYVKD